MKTSARFLLPLVILSDLLTVCAPAQPAKIQLKNNDGYCDPANPPVLVNLVSNPSVEKNTNGYTGNSGATMSRKDNGPNYVGIYGIEVTTANTNDAGVVYGNATILPASPGLMYTASWYARLKSQGTKNMELLIVWKNSSDNITGFAETLITLNSTTFARFEVSDTAPSGTTYARIAFYTKGAGQGVFEFWVDALQFEVGSPATTYVDGDQDNCRWSGTPHASPSDFGGPYYPNLVSAQW